MNDEKRAVDCLTIALAHVSKNAFVPIEVIMLCEMEGSRAIKSFDAVVASYLVGLSGGDPVKLKRIVKKHDGYAKKKTPANRSSSPVEKHS